MEPGGHQVNGKFKKFTEWLHLYASGTVVEQVFCSTAYPVYLGYTPMDEPGGQMFRPWLCWTACALLAVSCTGRGTEDDPSNDDTGGGSILPPGEPVGNVWTYAGISGDRSWLYSREDTRQLIVDDAGGAQNGTTISNALTYIVDDGEAQVYYEHTIEWAAGPAVGIEIKSHNGTIYSPPIRLAEPEAFIGDVTTTTQANSVFTSTLLGFEDCPNSFTDKWTCLHIQISADSNEYFVGEWYFAPEWGPAIFRPDVEDYDWVLRQANVIE